MAVKPEGSTGVKYTTVKKERWDSMWHACWKDKDGNLVWDRVNKETAMYIVKHM